MSAELARAARSTHLLLTICFHYAQAATLGLSSWRMKPDACARLTAALLGAIKGARAMFPRWVGLDAALADARDKLPADAGRFRPSAFRCVLNFAEKVAFQIAMLSGAAAAQPLADAADVDPFSFTAEQWGKVRRGFAEQDAFRFGADDVLRVIDRMRQELKMIVAAHPEVAGDAPTGAEILADQTALMIGATDSKAARDAIRSAPEAWPDGPIPVTINRPKRGPMSAAPEPVPPAPLPRCSVVLRGPDQGPLVFGEALPAVSPAAYAALQALGEAYGQSSTDGLDGKTLDAEASRIAGRPYADVRTALRQLRTDHEAWRRAILPAGNRRGRTKGTSRGWRLAPESP